jgi:hypothetical protein
VHYKGKEALQVTAEARHAWIFMGSPRIFLLSPNAAAAPRKNYEGCHAFTPTPQACSVVSGRKGGAAPKIGRRRRILEFQSRRVSRLRDELVALAEKRFLQ